MDQKKYFLTNLAKGGMILFFGILLSKFLGYAYRVIIARLGADIYGELSLALAVFGILATISILGLDMGTLRYISTYLTNNQNKKIRSTILFNTKTVLTLSILLSVLAIVFSDFISQTFFHTDSISILIKIIAIALPFEALKAINVNTFKAFKKIELDVFIRIVGENVIKIILTIIFILLGLSVTGAVLAYTCAIIISSLTSLFILERNVFSILKTKITEKIPRKEIIFYSLPLLFNSLLIMIISWIDTLMLGFFKTTTDVGIYNAAIPTAKLILIIPTSLLAIYLPIITQVIQDKKELKKIYYTTTKWILLVNTLFLGAAILYGKNLLQILFGSEYIAGYAALSILIFSYYINGLSYTSRDILMVLKKTKTIFYATLAGGTTNIILNYILIPKYNLIGAAIATSISLIIISIIIYFSAKISIINKNLIKILIAGAIATLATFYITTNIYIGAIVLTILYTLLLYLLKTFEKQDKDLITAIKTKLGLK